MASKHDKHLICENRKARKQYEISETFECGIVLRGTEVKTLRGGTVSIAEAYARFDGKELFLVGAHIEEYTHGNRMNHEPTRKRKLLLRRRELQKLLSKVEQRGFTLVPLEMYFNEKGWAKVLIGVAKGKKIGDKRQSERAKDARAEIRAHL
ncbi:MAG: SsrA-binding protein SmpB [Planctomycetes bacterium]|nr:SsrA-binding protein SmpB [Planctomycetota bacterium]